MKPSLLKCPLGQRHLLVFCPQSSRDCPQILPSALAPMPTGSSQTIPVRLANAAFFQVSGGQARWEGREAGGAKSQWGPLLGAHHPRFGFLALSFQVLLERARSGCTEKGKGSGW